MELARWILEFSVFLALAVTWAEVRSVKRALDREVEKLQFLDARLDDLESRLRLAEQFGIISRPND